MRLGPGPEFDLIRRFVGAERGGEAHPRVLVGPGDDCAVLSAGKLAVSADLSVEGIHFRRAWLAPEEIGWRAAAAAISDLAAMAASPLGVLVSVAAAPADAGDFAAGVMAGVRDAARQVGATLLGGDTTRSPGPLVLDVMVLGEAESPVLRAGADPGDELWVTGALGGAAAAVHALVRDRQPDPACRRPFARPEPRIFEALWLAERGLARAMLDLSDGIGGDAAHLAAASGVAVVLAPDRLPRHPCASDEQALGGGEDFELLFAARPGSVDAHVAEFRARWGLPLTRVGRVEAGEGVWTERGGARTLLAGVGFQHFAAG